MRDWIMLRVEDREQDQARRTNDCSNNTANTQNRLPLRVVRRQSSLVSKPSLGNEGNIEDDHHHRATGNEERFQECRSDV